jgi:hypothetical protein
VCPLFSGVNVIKFGDAASKSRDDHHENHESTTCATSNSPRISLAPTRVDHFRDISVPTITYLHLYLLRSLRSRASWTLRCPDTGKPAVGLSSLFL